ncbi:hypothetical protein ES288_A13G193800v1 [Gossypium darwinii]|uniref:Uncharacterized protein n=1 Tax=Gossypium darwinii TaxID=34276 RepID=A0A5D2E1E2_GOSDA|nr:hypothetical protein ES288_A13G193800v1 [Gossypium darwinii]
MNFLKKIISPLHKGKKKKGRRGRERDAALCASVLTDSGLHRRSTPPPPPWPMAHGLRLQARRYGGTRWRVRRWYGRVEVEALAIIVLEAVAAPSEWG